MFLYFYYNYRNKKNPNQVLVIVLKVWINFQLTFLFHPIIDTWMSVMNCYTNLEGKTVMKFHSDQECFNTVNTLHAVFGLVFIFLVFIFNSTMHLLYFEGLRSANNPMAVFNNHYMCSITTYQQVIIFAFNLPKSRLSDYLTLSIMIIGTISLFNNMHFDKPHYNNRVSRTYSTLAALLCWGSIMILFAEMFEGNWFEGSLKIYFTGIPFIIIILWIGKDNRERQLMLETNKWQNPEEFLAHLRYLNELIQNKTVKALNLLDGHLELHKHCCTKTDCPVKQGNITDSLSEIQSKIVLNKHKESNTIPLTIALMNRMYQETIKRYNNNPGIRLEYAQFLDEQFELKQQSLYELSISQFYNPALDHEFQIYRYKTVLQNAIFSNTKTFGSEGLDILNELQQTKVIQNCEDNIERIGWNYLEFWSELYDHNSDKNKLLGIGKEINEQDDYIQNDFERILTNNAQTPRLLNKCGWQYKFILHDNRTSEEYQLQAGEIINDKTQRENLLVKIIITEDLANSADRTIIISGDIESLGTITAINMACSKLFGYTKTEIQNKRINAIMPDIFSRKHNSFLEKFLTTNEVTLLNLDVSIVGLHKTGYMFDIFTKIRPIQSAQLKQQFVGSMRPHVSSKMTAIILTNMDGIIENLSDTCLSVLKIDQNYIIQCNNIEELIPGIMVKKENYKKIDFEAIDYTPPEKSKIATREEKLASYKVKLEVYDGWPFSRVHGIAWKFTQPKIEDNCQILNLKSKKNYINEKHFQFNYDIDKQIVIGEVKDPLCTKYLLNGQTITQDLISGQVNENTNQKNFNGLFKEYLNDLSNSDLSPMNEVKNVSNKSEKVVINMRESYKNSNSQDKTPKRSGKGKMQYYYEQVEQIKKNITFNNSSSVYKDSQSRIINSSSDKIDPQKNKFNNKEIFSDSGTTYNKNSMILKDLQTQSYGSPSKNYSPHNGQSKQDIINMLNKGKTHGEKSFSAKTAELKQEGSNKQQDQSSKKCNLNISDHIIYEQPENEEQENEEQENKEQENEEQENEESKKIVLRIKETKKIILKKDNELDENSCESNDKDVQSNEENLIQEQEFTAFRLQNTGVEIISENLKYMDFIKSDKYKENNINEKKFVSLDQKISGFVSKEQFNTTIKSRKKLKQIVSQSTYKFKILKVYILSLIFIVSILGLAIVDYLMIKKEFSNIDLAMQYSRQSSMQSSEIMNIVSKIRSLVLLNYGINNSYKNYDTVQTEAFDRELITYSISEVENFKRGLSVNSIKIDISKKHKTLLQDQTVKLIDYNNNVSYVNLNDATTQILTKAINIGQKKLEEIITTDYDIWFINYNCLNEYLEAIFSNYHYFANNLKERMDPYDISQLSVLFVSLAWSIMLACIIIISIFKCIDIKTSILSLFLEIPEMEVEFLYKETHKFMFKIYEENNMCNLNEQQNNPDEVELKNNVDLQLGRMQVSNQTNKKKEYRINKSEKKPFVILFILFLCTILVYFAQNYYQLNMFFKEKINSQQEFDLLTFYEGLFYYSINVQETLYIPDIAKVKTFQGKNPTDVVRQDITKLFEHDSELNKQHGANNDKLEENYRTLYNRIYVGDPCVVIEMWTNSQTIRQECETFGDGALKTGMGYMMQRIFSDITYDAVRYYYYGVVPDSHWDEDGITCPAISGLTSIQNNQICLPLTDRSHEIEQFEDEFFSLIMRTQSEAFKSGINIQLNEHLYQKFSFIIGLFVYIIVSLVLFWIPYVFIQKRNMMVTKQMISMVPCQIIAKAPRLRTFVMSLNIDANSGN